MFIVMFSFIVMFMYSYLGRIKEVRW